MSHDVLAHPLGRGGGERHHRRAGKVVAQVGDLPVFRAEIVAPFGDAMRLVHGDLRDVPLLQALEKAGGMSRSGAT